MVVTDAAIIGNYAGTTLLVCRFEMNTVKEIEVSIQRLEQSGVSVKGCILNGVIKTSYSYGYIIIIMVILMMIRSNNIIKG